MADHRIERVDRLVGDDAWQAEQRAPEHRRDDAIGGVLRKALDRRARHPGFIQQRGVAPDDPGDGGARDFELTGLERARDGSDMIVERP
jgi:hypothetical protein